jgi:hypothetical protein
MFGTLAGALAGRKIPFDRQQYTATVDGRVVGVGRTIKIESIAVHYELTASAEHRDALERALWCILRAVRLIRASRTRSP